MSRLALHLLGPPRVELDGQPVHIRRSKAVALLAYLAVTAIPHSREALATLLWPESTPSRARASLRRVLVTLRQALGEGWLDIQPETLSLQPGTDLWLDAAVFQERLAACQTREHPPDQVCPDCAPLLTEAVELYQDDFLAGFTLPDSLAFDEWQFFQSERLRDELVSALRRLVRWHAERDEHDPAIAYARRWLELDPLHEPAHCELMRLYLRAGRRNAALRQYRTCIRVLEEELGVPPSPETTALYEQVRATREVRPLKPTPAPPPPAAAPAFLGEGKRPVEVKRPVFVARELPLAQLNAFLQAALAGHGKVVFITGGPGRGKTTLTHEFARRAIETHPNLLVASGACNAYAGVGDPYLPFREVLAVLTGDVESRWSAGAISHEAAQRLWASVPLAAQALLDHGPYLIDALVSGPALLSRATATAADDSEWLGELEGWVQRERPAHTDLEQRAIFEQCTNVLSALAAHHPLLLTLDDLQWADNGSIGLLFHLGRWLAATGERLLIVGAYRPEEVALGRDGARHPLEEVLTELKRRFGDVWLDLTREDEVEGFRFVDALLDTEPNRLRSDFRSEMFRHTGGHPLFTVELLRSMQERGHLVRDRDGAWIEGPALDWETLPARVEAVIEARAGRLDEELRDMLTVASVEGERFTAQVIAQMQQVPEREVLRTLSQELGARHRLVREAEEDQVDGRFLSHYQFAHVLFQMYFYGALSAGEQRLLHGEVAVALEALYGEQVEMVVVQLAHHFAAAGHLTKAIEYTLRAGDRARSTYANEEAMAYYQRALVLLDGSSFKESRKDWRLEALKGLGRTCEGAGKAAEAEQYLRETITLGQEVQLPRRDLVRLYHSLGEVLYWQGRFDDRIRVGEEGLALLGDDTESVEAALMNQAVAVGYDLMGNREKFREFTYRTAAFLQRFPYSEELWPAYAHVVWVYIDDKDIEGAMKWLRTLEEWANRHRDLRALGAVRFWSARLLTSRGDLQGGVSQYQQGLELFTKTGDAANETVCLLAMGQTYLALGDLREAEVSTLKGFETAKAVGNRADMPWANSLIGQLLLCQGIWEEAVDALQEAMRTRGGIMVHSSGEPQATLAFLRGYLAHGGQGEPPRRIQKAIALARPEAFRRETVFLAGALSAFEQAYDEPAAFRAFCHRLREENPEFGDAAFVRWFLEPADVGVYDGTPHHHDTFAESLSSDWVWLDPFNDCSFNVQNGLEICAVNGRDLWHINLSAPRMMRPAPEEDDFALQTLCLPVSDDTPAIGGLLLWKDKENYLRLDRGTRGAYEISFQGCMDNHGVIIGRGRLETGITSGRVFLRLERIGDRVNALCSADRQQWFSVGEVAFPVEGRLQVGLHAIGNIDRTIYHGAYPDGTAIRFESFTLWGLER